MVDATLSTDDSVSHPILTLLSCRLSYTDGGLQAMGRLTPDDVSTSVLMCPCDPDVSLDETSSVSYSE